MFDVIVKWVMHKQLKFEEGRIELFGQKIVMFPVYTLASIIQKLEKQSSSNLLYYTMKELGIKWTNLLNQYYHIKKKDVFEFGSKTVTMAGWGIVKTISADPDKHTIRFALEDSSVAEEYGKAKYPVCHPFRGMIAGAMSVAYDDKLDTIETKCKATGARRCEFIVAPTKQFDIKDPMIKRQLKIPHSY